MITLKQSSSTDLSSKTSDSLEGHRILILTSDDAGEEGICLGRIAGTDRWAVSPDSSTAILELHFESEFAVLLDLSDDRQASEPVADCNRFRTDAS